MPKAFENPPPPSRHAVSSPTTERVAKSVPPTDVTYGELVGKSGLNTPFFGAPVRPHTPWSPDAKSTVAPRAPSFISSALTDCMYASPDCWRSSLPYETE